MKKVILVVIGTIIGAGFASGQEIWIFFYQYGKWGILGMIVSCIFTGIIIYQVFRMPEKKNSEAISIIVSLFLLLSFYIMIAGMSALFNQEFGIPIFVGSILMSLFCYLVLQRDMKGIMLINSILIPCLILFILYLGIKNIDFTISNFAIKTIESQNSWKWILSSILYASYNSIMLVPMLIELKPYITTKSKTKKVAIICASILVLLGISLFTLLLRGTSDIYILELPMVEIVKNFGTLYKYLYISVVVAAIFTTAISSGYGFLKNQISRKRISKGDISKRENLYYQKVLLAICISAPLVSNIGFSNLVSKLYPIFGILGLIQVVFLFKKEK